MEAKTKEVEFFYNQNGIIVRRSIKADVEYLKNHLKQNDIDEICASNNLAPEEALKEGLKNSIFCCTVLDDNPIMMFGVVPETLLGKKGIVWMLSSSELIKIQRRFLRHSRHFIDMMLEFYPYLCNYVDERNKESIAWLKFCGAVIKEPIPYGVEGKLFHYFYFKKRR